MIQRKKIPNRKADVKRYDYEHLRQPGIAETFHQRIEGSFEPLLALDLEIDELYVKFKNTLNEVTKKTVGLPKRKFIDGLTQQKLICITCVERQGKKC